MKSRGIRGWMAAPRSFVGLPIFLALLAGGCATLRTVEPLPAGAAKGYAVFYGEVTGQQAVDVQTVSVRDITAGRRGGAYSLALIRQKDSGTIPAMRWLGNRYIHKIACAPGRHLFRVNMGATFAESDVEVAAGMITPVKIEMNTVLYDNPLYPERVFFALSASAAPPAKPPVTILGQVVE